MCYTRNDHGLEEEARRLRAEEDRLRKAGSKTKPADEERDKTLAEKAKEMVGAR